MPTDLNSVPQELVVDFDVFDPALAGSEDKFQDAVAALRKIGPVVYTTAHGGHWVVTGYQAAHKVLRDPARFSSYPNDLHSDGTTPRILPLELDPPQHTAYRQALQPLFSPTRMKAMTEQIRATVNELMDGFTSRGEAEFVSEFAHELPARVFLALMDLPLEDAPLFTEATDTFLVGKPGLSEEEQAAVHLDAQMRMAGYFMQTITERRSRPEVGQDVTSAIIHTPVEIDGEKRLLTDEELTNMLFLLLIAGLHTVQGSLGWAVKHLGSHPEQQKAITADPTLIPSAVEEVLRIEAAVSMARKVMQDTEVAGVQLKEGDQILVSLASANRDDEEFEDPDTLDIERDTNRHLSFGAGPHRCLGSHLARVELAIALEEMHRRIPDYRMDPDAEAEWHSSQVRGVRKLPVVFTPETVR